MGLFQNVLKEGGAKSHRIINKYNVVVRVPKFIGDLGVLPRAMLVN